MNYGLWEIQNTTHREYYYMFDLEQYTIVQQVEKSTKTLTILLTGKLWRFRIVIS